MDQAIDLPPNIAARVIVPDGERQMIGRSRASVHRLISVDGEAVYLKHEASHAFCEIPEEAERLCWLGAQGIVCPTLLAVAHWQGREWLLASAVKGQNLVAAMADTPPADLARIAASGLRRLHGLDVATCPFDHRFALRVERARRHLDAGVVDPEDFDKDHNGLSPAALFDRLARLQPETADLVVTHGDACLPNLMMAGGAFSGFVDCGRLGVADRYQDLTLACGSIERNFGARFVPVFLDAYGAPSLDAERMRAYRMLDEFF